LLLHVECSGCVRHQPIPPEHEVLSYTPMNRFTSQIPPLRTTGETPPTVHNRILIPFERRMLAFFQNLFRGPNALIVVLLFIVVFILLRRSDNKPKSN
jgi:hypothetical protein